MAIGVTKARMFLSRLLVLVTAVAIATTEPTFAWGTWPAFGMQVAGYVLLVVATFGRLWCHCYIGGYKWDTRKQSGSLITVGPYSIVRNPLYMFSFIGALGVGLAADKLVAMCIILLAYLLLYPFVVLKEERKLAGQYGGEFTEYAQRVPRWFPNFTLYTEPEEYVIRTKYVRKALLDSMWFLYAYMALELVRRLQMNGILPQW